MDQHLFLLPLAAACISFFCSMGGVSGAFLLLPFQISMLHHVQPSVSATNQVFNLIATPSGIYRYYREKRLLWPLALLIALGTLPGVAVGAYLRIVYLPNPEHFKIFAGTVLLYIGGRLIYQTGRFNLRLPSGKNISHQHTTDDPVCRNTRLNWKELSFSYQGIDYSCSSMALLILCLFIGVIGGCYGIGGGAILAPLLTSYFALPLHATSGATLCGTFLNSVAGLGCYYIAAFFFPEQSIAPNWEIGLLLGAGGLCGMYAGARCQKFVNEFYLQLMLALIISGMGLAYCLPYFLNP